MSTSYEGAFAPQARGTVQRASILATHRHSLAPPTLAAFQVFEYLSGFRKYDWLWKEDKDVQYKRFVASNPAISDYEAELAKFMDIESEIEAIPTFHNVGPLTLNTTNLKLQLGSESRQWKIQYSNKVRYRRAHSRATCPSQEAFQAASPLDGTQKGGGVLMWRETFTGERLQLPR